MTNLLSSNDATEIHVGIYVQISFQLPYYFKLRQRRIFWFTFMSTLAFGSSFVLLAHSMRTQHIIQLLLHTSLKELLAYSFWNKICRCPKKLPTRSCTSDTVNPKGFSLAKQQIQTHFHSMKQQKYMQAHMCASAFNNQIQTTKNALGSFLCPPYAGRITEKRTQPISQLQLETRELFQI